MNENPFSSAAAKQRAFERVDREYRAWKSVAVPTVEAVKIAFVHDRIDVDQLDELMGAAVEGRAVELPASVFRGSRAHLTDAPGQVVEYHPIKSRYRSRPIESQNASWILKEMYRRQHGK